MRRPAAKSQLWLAIALLLTLVAVPVQLRGVLHVIPSHFSDLFSPWMGSRALLHGADPYTLDFTHRIQLRFYGVVPKDPRVDTMAFVYPAHAAFLLAPLAELPFKVARATLTAALPVLVALAAWWWAELCGLRRGRWLAIGLVACTWPAIWAYQQTQLTVVVVAAMAGACFLVARKRDFVAGLLLAVATMKPNLAALLILWLLVQMAMQRRWRFLLGFTVPTLALLGASLALWPGWIPRWLAAVRAYGGPYKPPLLMLICGRAGGVAAAALLCAWVVYRLWKIGLSRPGTRGFADAVALLLAFTTCLLPSTYWMIYNELALIPAVYLVFATEKPRLTQLLARLCVVELIAALPVCAAILLVTHRTSVVVVIPFLNLLIPPMLAIAMASNGSKELTPAGSLAPAAV